MSHKNTGKPLLKEEVCYLEGLILLMMLHSAQAQSVETGVRSQGVVPTHHISSVMTIQPRENISYPMPIKAEKDFQWSARAGIDNKRDTILTRLKGKGRSSFQTPLKHPISFGTTHSAAHLPAMKSVASTKKRIPCQKIAHYDRNCVRARLQRQVQLTKQYS